MNSRIPLVIDSNQLCYRSFYTMNDLSYNEKKTGVLFGFLAQIFKLAQDFDTKTFIFCWDSAKSYRKQIYSEYKMNRKKDLSIEEQDDLKSFYKQRNELRIYILPSLGFKNNFIQTGLEADDLIAWVVNKIKGTTVVSSDSDLYQLLDRCTMFDIRKKERIDEGALYFLFGIKAKDWIEVKKIAGCNTDNVKGIEGVGETKAIQYIYDKMPSGVIKRRIQSKEAKKIIERNEKLVRLPFKEDIKGVMKEIDLDEKFLLDDWLNVFNKYSFNHFLKKENLNKLKEVFELK